jgi:hypothetical protein
MVASIHKSRQLLEQALKGNQRINVGVSGLLLCLANGDAILLAHSKS